jgi:hypothetical protein
MGPIGDTAARAVSWSAGAVAAAVARLRWLTPVKARPHGLSGPVVVSLTSYGPRLASLHLTLKCLLRQTVKPDAVVLWLAEPDLDVAPDSLREMQTQGVRLMPTEDLKSFKKIIPALKAWPEAFVVTADDDVYYRSTWLEELIGGWSGDPREIVSRRARRIALGPDGAPEPYARWRWCHEQGLVSTTLLPVGMGGVLFPPGSLARPDVFDQASFMQLCPTADDMWLYWMARKAGSVVRKVGRQRTYFFWPRTQDVGLANINRRAGANDVQIRSMVDRFGFPAP